MAELKTALSLQPGWTFVLPGGHSLVVLYSVAQPTGSEEAELAAKIVARLREPGTAAKVTGENYLGATQSAAKRQQPAVVREDKLIYPDEKVLDHSTFVGQ